MSLELQLCVVSQTLSLLLLRVLKHAAVVQLVNDVVLDMGLVKLWMALHAKDLLTNSKHLELNSLRRGEVSGLRRQLRNKITVALKLHGLFQLLLNVHQQVIIDSSPEFLDRFDSVTLVQKCWQELDCLFSDILWLG